MKVRILFAALLLFSTLSMADAVDLSRIAVVTVFDHPIEEFSSDDIKAAAEDVFLQSGRFDIVDVSSHPDYRGTLEDQNLRLQTIAADLNVDMFMLLDVSSSHSEVRSGSPDSLFTGRNVSVDITGRFYTSSGNILGSVREKRYTGTLRSAASVDMNNLAVQGVTLVARRSLNEIFPYEFSFTADSGPVFSIPVGTENGIRKGMVFSIIALSRGMPRSLEEYRQLGSHGILQVTRSTGSSCQGRLITGNLVEGASVIAIENSTPGILALSYAILPVEIIPGDGLPDEDSETSGYINQAEFTGGTCKWGFSLTGSLFSGVISRMSSIGIRGEIGTRLPLASPSLALRLGAGFEARYLTQNTRSDSVSAVANTATMAGTVSADIELLFTSKFGIRAGGIGRLGTNAENWGVTDWTGYNRDALPGELYYTQIKQSPVSFSIGLVYMIY